MSDRGYHATMILLVSGLLAEAIGFGCWTGAPPREFPPAPRAEHPPERVLLRVDDSCRHYVQVEAVPEWPSYEHCDALATPEQSDACRDIESRWAMVKLYNWIDLARWRCTED